jgi:hypothetical protein
MTNLTDAGRGWMSSTLPASRMAKAPSVTGPTDLDIATRVAPVGPKNPPTRVSAAAEPRINAQPPTLGTGGSRVLSSAPRRTPSHINTGMSAAAEAAPTKKTRRYEPTSWLSHAFGWAETLPAISALSTGRNALGPSAP